MAFHDPNQLSPLTVIITTILFGALVGALMAYNHFEMPIGVIAFP